MSTRHLIDAARASQQQPTAFKRFPSPVRRPVNRPPKLPDPEPDHPDVFLPSLEDIREACLAIQSTWTEHERKFRRGATPGDLIGYKPPTVLPCLGCGKPVETTGKKPRCFDCKRIHHRKLARVYRAERKGGCR